MPSILTLTDRAICNYLVQSGVLDDTGVFPFKRSADKGLPCVIVHSHRATPLKPFDPTFEVDVAILVRTNAAIDEPQGDTEETPRNESDDLMDLVTSALYRFGDGEQSTGQLADAITDAGRGIGLAFTCMAAELSSHEQSVDYQHQMDAWTETVNLKLTCCPSNVS